MIAPDTSVLVASFATWHEGHAAALRALSRGVRLIAHAAVETYSVLTRLPPPHRVSAAVAQAYLANLASGDYLMLAAHSHPGMICQLAEHNITGGAAYDALIGSTATAAGAVLLTRDRRALPTYEKLNVQFELVI